MAIDPSSIMQFTWQGRCFGQVIRHTRTWRLLSGGTAGGNGFAYAQAFLPLLEIGGPADWTSPYIACLSSDYKLERYLCQVIYPIRSAYTFTDIANPVAGTRAGTSTANLQAAVESSTAFAGRSQVSVSKIGPTSTADQTEGYYNPALVSLLLTYAATFTLDVTVAAPQASVWRPCIYHRNPTAPLGRYDDIIEASPRRTVRTKSTRTIGRGE